MGGEFQHRTIVEEIKAVDAGTIVPRQVAHFPPAIGGGPRHERRIHHNFSFHLFNAFRFQCIHNFLHEIGVIGKILTAKRRVAGAFHKNISFKFFAFLFAVQIHARIEGVVRAEQTQARGGSDGFHSGGGNARGIGTIARHHRVGFNVVERYGNGGMAVRGITHKSIDGLLRIFGIHSQTHLHHHRRQHKHYQSF